MQIIIKNPAISLYALKDRGSLKRYILSTPETRQICNDPAVCGLEYTDKLKLAMQKALAQLPESLDVNESQGIVFNILRGGLNFGLREALAEGKDWMLHRTAFISAQRVYDDKEGWHITENRYEKVYLPDEADIYLGDVVATGVSLEYALKKIVSLAKEQKVSFKRITFFTFGSERAEELMEEVDNVCRQEFCCYEESRVVYIEGIFGLPKDNSNLSIAIPGTDLLRYPAILAPEFLESQTFQVAYPLERCIIYDAGSRAFNVSEYLADVREYWEQVKLLAQQGISYAEYLKQRCPQSLPLNEGREILQEIAQTQIEKYFML